MEIAQNVLEGIIMKKVFVLTIVAVLASLVIEVAAADVAFSKPALLTSIGQSSEIAVIKVLLNTKLQMGIDCKPIATVADLAGLKSLLIVVGASTKGLGAAGLDLDKETQRAKALMQACKEQGIKILVLHTGGEARRGKTTNDLIKLVAPEAAYLVVVASGNKDKFFQTTAGTTPLAEVESLAAAGEAVKAAFK
jgi:hypothetical protein